MPEALKYYNHSIEVLNQISQSPSGLNQPTTLLPLLAELGKVHLSLSTLHKQLGDRPTCIRHLETSILKFEGFCDEMENVDEQVSRKYRPKDMTYEFYMQIKEEEKVVSKLLFEAKLMLKEI